MEFVCVSGNTPLAKVFSRFKKILVDFISGVNGVLIDFFFKLDNNKIQYPSFSLLKVMPNPDHKKWNSNNVEVLLQILTNFGPDCLCCQSNL